MFSVDITSVGPDGKECQLLDTTVGVVAGYVEPVVMRLAPGAADYVGIDLKKLICVSKDATVALDSLLARSHSVLASFTGKPESNAWAKVVNGWAGSVTSGTYRPRPLGTHRK